LGNECGGFRTGVLRILYSPGEPVIIGEGEIEEVFWTKTLTHPKQRMCKTAVLAE